MSNRATQDLIQVVVFLAITGSTIIFHAFKRMRLSRRIEDMPTALIGSAPQGSVELQGYAWPVESLQSPLTLKPCVFYKLIIEEERRSKNNSTWVKVFETQSDRPFAAVDKSGYAMVFPEGAEVNARPLTLMSLTGAQMTAVQTLLNNKSSRVNLETGFFHGKKRFIECAVFAGSPLYVLGNFKTISGFRPYNLVAGCDLFMSRISGFNPQLAMAQGRNISERENTVQYLTIAEECGNFGGLAAASGSHFTLPSDHAGVSPDLAAKYSASCGNLMNSPESPLFFADAHQSEVLKRMGSYNWLKVVGGAILLAAAVTFAFAKFTHH